MNFGTFRKTADENPLEVGTGDRVIAYESDDGWEVGAVLTHRGGHEQTMTGTARQMEYLVYVEGPEDPSGLLEEEPGQFTRKADAAREARELLRALVEQGRGAH